MAAKQYQTHYIELIDAEKGGSKGEKVRHAWRAPNDTYTDEIAKALGVIKVKAEDKTKGLIFGANYPRAARVRINIKLKQGKSKSVLLFADPRKIPSLMIGNVLRGKQYRGCTITTVTLPGTSTNPNRGKGDGKKNSNNNNRNRKNNRNKNNRRKRR